jgi:RNA polymerase sigma-70 factor (ECF subfamily)
MRVCFRADGSAGPEKDKDSCDAAGSAIEGAVGSRKRNAPQHGGQGTVSASMTRWSRNSVAMASRQELSDFLVSVERRAFKQAQYAVRDRDAALDVVQDAMFKLADKYADKPGAELPLLFQRILQNVIHDHFRRQKVRSLWTTLLSSLQPGDDDGGGERDPLETLEAGPDGQGGESAAQQVEREQVLRAIDDEIQKLPPRQREAFVMRYWQDMDVSETAAAMGCSEGSVKTHCSRATHTLAAALKARGITL